MQRKAERSPEEILPFPMEETAEDPLIIQCVGRSHWVHPRENAFAPAVFYGVEFIHEGRGWVESASGRYSLSAGDLFLLQKGKAYRYGTVGGFPLIKSWITVRGALMEYLLRIYGLSETTVVPHQGGTEAIFRALLARSRRAKKEGWHARRLARPVALWLHEALSLASESAHARQEKLTPAVARMKVFLESQGDRPVPSKELAAVAGLSVSQSIRRFRSELGTTPYAWHLQERLLRAEYLLSHTCEVVRVVAGRCGFSDAHYFSALFKEKTGKSPSEYRGSGRPA
ncbi:MAG: helix-turn-helix transcriptional regulator [Spirochaetes bacterium]|nr:helix-turn-helix transcriptional regulator [Spirochaetota bacterium]